MDRPRVALVGAGRRARSGHLPVLTKLGEEIDFVAVCDRDPAAAEAVARQCGVRAYTDLRAMLEAEGPDLCDVVVPADAHHAVSCFLSQYGVHQLVETPVGATPGLADLMAEAARAHGVKVEVSEQFPRTPVEQVVQGLLQRGAIGRVGRIYRLFSTSEYHGVAAVRARAGGRVTQVSGIAHEMPVEPYVDGKERHWDRESLEFTAIDFDNGVLGLILVGNKNNALGRNTLVGFEVDGSTGTIVTNGNVSATGGEAVWITDEAARRQGGRARKLEFQRSYVRVDGVDVLEAITVDLPDGPFVWHNPFLRYGIGEREVAFATMLMSIVTAVREGREPLYGVANARLDLEVCVAARRSGRSGRQPIPLPLAPDPEEEEATRQHFLSLYGRDPYDVEGLLAVSFPRV